MVYPSSLYIITGIESDIEKDLKCSEYKETKEDEVHFVLCCHVLMTLKSRLLPPKICKHLCIFRLNLLLASTKKLSENCHFIFV